MEKKESSHCCEYFGGPRGQQGRSQQGKESIFRLQPGSRAGVKSQTHVVWQPTWQCREQRCSIFVQTVRSLFKWWKPTWVVPLGQPADGRRVQPLAAHQEGKIISSVQGERNKRRPVESPNCYCVHWDQDLTSWHPTINNE